MDEIDSVQAKSAPLVRGVTLAQGTALYLGAVLGTGVIALPALAAKMAGPASLIAWLGLVIASVPLAATFAALGARYPDAGGVSTYARRAFGPSAATVVGWCFYLSSTIAGPGSAMLGAAYVAVALGGGRTTVLACTAAALVIVGVANWFGVRLSGRVELILAGLLLILLAAAVLTSVPRMQLSNLHPFAPHGWLGVGQAAGLLVWSFAGWEAITYLAAEFKRPRRDLPRATALALITVGISYVAIAGATLLVLGRSADTSQAPLGQLLATGLGGSAPALTAVVAVILTLGVMNPYCAGSAKLGAALGRDGSMPAWLSRGSQAGEVPRRSLLVQTGLSVLVLLVVALTGSGPQPLLLATNGCLLVVYAIGTFAAIRLLPRQRAARAAAVAGFVISLGLLAATGVYLVVPAVITGCSLAYLRWQAYRSRIMAASEAQS
jgi:amino acid efflux transporter